MTKGMLMRKTMFWLITTGLAVVLLGTTFMWFASFQSPSQVVLRAGTPGVTVLTSDRGRLGFLMLGRQPDGEKWVLRYRSNEKPAADAQTLDQLCTDHGLGFGMDQQVNIAGLEAPAVAGVAAGQSWAARRIVVPWWSLASFSLIGLVIWSLTKGVRMYRMERGLCGKCSFDVSQSSHFCPRCGKAIPRRTWSGDVRPRRGEVVGRAARVAG